MAANIHGACRANAAVFVIYCMCPRDADSCALLSTQFRRRFRRDYGIYALNNVTAFFVHHIVSMPLCLLRIVLCIWHLRIDYHHAAFMHHIVPMPLCLLRSTAFVHHYVSMPLCLLRSTAFVHHYVSMPLCLAFIIH